jgi:hypothetical protein
LIVFMNLAAFPLSYGLPLRFVEPIQKSQRETLRIP